MLNNNILEEKNNKKTVVKRYENQNYPLLYPRGMAESMFLSFEARGLYSYLLTLPEDFEVTAEFLHRHFQNPYAWPLCYFQNLLDELVEFGHLKRVGGK